MSCVWTSTVKIGRTLNKIDFYLLNNLSFKCHPRNSTHLYDYEGTVDDDLICHICFQPFVDPIDTKCGCTYCSDCLQVYLKRHKYCPIDNTKIDWKHCHKASQVLRKYIYFRFRFSALISSLKNKLNV